MPLVSQLADLASALLGIEADATAASDVVVTGSALYLVQRLYLRPRILGSLYIPFQTWRMESL
jgi:hypothetical protein